MNSLQRLLPRPHPSSPTRGRSGDGDLSSPPPSRVRSGGVLATLLAFLLLASPAYAIDPPYQNQMERLSEIMGSLYYLEPLCAVGSTDWRAEAGDLIDRDQPDEDRRQRLAGAFNSGYTAFSRLHRQCTPASREALSRLLTEAEKLARDIHTRFAE